MAKEPGVLLLIRSLDSGGSERQVVEIAKYLHRERWNVHVGCFRKVGVRKQELLDCGVPILDLAVGSFGSFSALHGVRRLAQYSAMHRIAVTHSFDPPTNIWGSVAGNLTRTPVVITSQRSYRTIRTRRDKALLRVTDKIADAVVVNCEAMRRHLIKDEGVREDRIHLCYNGIDTNVFFPAREERPDNLKSASLVVGAISVLRPEKGLLTLVEGFARMRHDRPGVELVIVGNGPMKESLENAAAAGGARGEVVFEPATADVPKWLHRLDAFVLPSLSEAFSNSLMEAMACGVPSVASDVGGNPELIEQGVSGLLFPVGDADALADRLRTIVTNETLRRTMAENALRTIRSRLTMPQSAARMMEIYRTLLASRGLS